MVVSRPAGVLNPAPAALALGPVPEPLLASPGLGVALDVPEVVLAGGHLGHLPLQGFGAAATLGRGYYSQEKPRTGAGQFDEERTIKVGIEALVGRGLHRTSSLVWDLDEIPLHRVLRVVLETSLHVLAVVLESEPDLTAGHAALCLIVATVPDGLAASYTFTAKFQRPFLLGEGLVAGVLKDVEQEVAEELLLVRDPVDASRVEDVLLEVDNVLCASPPTRTSWELKL